MEPLYKCTITAMVLLKSSEIIDNNVVFKTNHTTAHKIRKNLMVKIIVHCIKSFEIVSSFTVGLMVNNYYF